MFDAKCSGGDGDQYMKGLRVACTVGRCFATTQNLKKTFLYLLYLYLYLLCSMLVFLIIDLFPEARKKLI